jgi:hypothetical protein
VQQCYQRDEATVIARVDHDYLLVVNGTMGPVEDLPSTCCGTDDDPDYPQVPTRVPTLQARLGIRQARAPDLLRGTWTRKIAGAVNSGPVRRLLSSHNLDSVLGRTSCRYVDVSFVCLRRLNERGGLNRSFVEIS